MLQFLTFWYWQSVPWTFQAYLRSIRSFEASLAVKDTARNLGKPLFQDYTLQGRFIGFLLRVVRIVVGLLLYFLISLCYLAAYVLWLLLPVAFVLAIVGSFFGPAGTASAPVSGLSV